LNIEQQNKKPQNDEVIPSIFDISCSIFCGSNRHSTTGVKNHLGHKVHKGIILRLLYFFVFFVLFVVFPNLLDHNGLNIDKLLYAVVRELAPIAALFDPTEGQARVGSYEIVDETAACL